MLVVMKFSGVCSVALIRYPAILPEECVMKKRLAVFVASSLFTVVAAATSFSEDQILHATFIAFQQPGVVTAEEIRHSRELLVAAARQGHSLARTVVARQYSPEKFALIT